MDDLTAEQVARATKSSRRRVQTWVARWNREGLAGLKDRPGRGPKLPLNAEQQTELKARLDAGNKNRLLGIEVRNPQPAKEWFALPAFMLLALVIVVQRRRNLKPGKR